VRVGAIRCSESTEWPDLLNLGLAAFTRFILTVFTFGLRVPAGLFIPSMAIGASFGRIVGTLMRLLYTYVVASGSLVDHRH